MVEVVERSWAVLGERESERGAKKCSQANLEKHSEVGTRC